MGKSCDPCHVCCTGIFQHEVYGQTVGNGIDCRFISTTHNNCSIYEMRPAQCSGFRCLWLSQDSWPEYMKPSVSGVMAYTNKKSGNHVVFTKDTTEEVKKFIETYFKERNMSFRKTIYLHTINKGN
jgi:Fe-S-cluster containining protein